MKIERRSRKLSHKIFFTKMSDENGRKDEGLKSKNQLLISRDWG